MAARGARSRKILDKDIEKKERKKDGDFRVQSPTGGAWTPFDTIKRSDTTSRKGSASQPPGFSRPSSASGISSISGHSQDPKSPKYKAKGKQSAAPRGRGAGVPTKSSSADGSASKSNSARRRAESSTSSSKWTGAQIWCGGGSTPKRYPGLDQDDALWMEDGDCYVYFTEETDSHDPVPSLRVHVKQLEKAKSVFLNNLLQYGRIGKDDVDAILPVSPGASYGSMNTRRAHAPVSRTISEHMGQLTLQWDAGELPMSQPWNSAGESRSPISPMDRQQTHLSAGSGMYSPSSDGSSPSLLDALGTEVTHELYFPAPAHLRTSQARRMFHLARRNFFAILYNKPLAGFDLFESLVELQNVIRYFYHMDTSQGDVSAQAIERHLIEQRLDDVRNSWRNALSLLAWSEQDSVRWQAGYMEAFVHSAGMMSTRMAESMEFRRLSTVTRHNLNNASAVLQLKVVEAEEKLGSFDLSEMFTNQVPPNSTHLKSFNAFREFFTTFYGVIYGNWPPETNRNGHWLTRDIVKRLQQDLGASYELLVDRDVSWEEREERASRKWQMVTKRPLPEFLAVDTTELPLTDIIVGYDNRHSYRHIPHPYPLLPQSSLTSPVQQTSKKSIFSALKKPKSTPTTTKDFKEKLQAAVVFSDASNIQKLGTAFEANDLVDQLERYEKAVTLKSVSAKDARLGRWLLLYGLLQKISTLSVDVQGLKYTRGVDYFLCPTLKNCPPWETNDVSPMIEADQTMSYCWLAPRQWQGLSTSPNPTVPALYHTNSGFEHRPSEHALPQSPVELDGTSTLKKSLSNQTSYFNQPHLQLHPINTNVGDFGGDSHHEHESQRRGLERKIEEERRAVAVAKYRGMALPPLPPTRPLRSPLSASPGSPPQPPPRSARRDAGARGRHYDSTDQETHYI